MGAMLRFRFLIEKSHLEIRDKKALISFLMLNPQPASIAFMRHIKGTGYFKEDYSLLENQPGPF